MSEPQLYVPPISRRRLRLLVGLLTAARESLSVFCGVTLATQQWTEAAFAVAAIITVSVFQEIWKPYWESA